MGQPLWEFWIDVGGTFTDCIARRPDGAIVTHKMLSSGVVQGRVGAGSTGKRICDPARRGDPPRCYAGFSLDLQDVNRRVVATGLRVASFDDAGAWLELEHAPPSLLTEGLTYSLYSGEEAPLSAIRYVMGLTLDDDIGPVSVRLGTTRGTNALLERKGARTGLVTTAGFADLPLIGTQDRPRLFELNIQKPQPLFEAVVEVDERVAIERPGTTGSAARTIKELDVDAVADVLRPLREAGITSLAVCLLNAYADPTHERIVADVARRMGFEQISVSTEVSPLIGMVSRCDTTVVDAYLTPVIRDYIDAIRSALPRGRFKLMTNAGGLIDADRVSGKESLLSGPAGGVVGCARVASRAGFDKVIGFDMGGTSTDVSRYDGRFEYQYETQKAGVRIVTPMLAIETVAAGGGSICRFDGQKLVVGPDSAGASPGPACYGHGGPLTVTDVNLHLGRIVPELFPFPLDEQAVAHKLGHLQHEVQTATGRRLSFDELADGCIRVVNESMAAAIRLISISRGYDVRDYVLVTFGGAGGQHACAVARRLGISRILIHPHAALLSALGIGLADVKRIGQLSVLRNLEKDVLRDLGPPVRLLAEKLGAQVADEGVRPDLIARPRVLLDLRYAGQESTITIADPTGKLRPTDTGDSLPVRCWREEFEQQHRQLYGHTLPGRSVEIVAARVEVVGQTDHRDPAAQKEVERHPQPSNLRRLVIAGQAAEAGLFLRDRLSPGDVVAGPALVVEANSVAVVEPGWEAKITALGDLLLEDRQGPTADQGLTVGRDIDPVTLEIFHNHFAHIAEQMGATLRRTALSTNVKERLDYSCAVFDGEGGLVANAPHIPVHLGAMGECVRCLIEDLPDLAPGDVLVTNDPFRGGSHLPDVTVVTPVFDGDARPVRFFTASRAHHAEIGGIQPGSMPPFSESLAQEGVVIRRLRVVEAGQPRFDRLGELLTAGPHPSRNPDENVADVAAAIASNQQGATALQSLVQRYGPDVVEAYMGHIQHAAEQKMRAALRRIPDGRYSFTDHLDDGTPIAVNVTVDDDRALIDFAGTGGVLPGNLNANRAIVTSAVLYCLRCLIDEDIPLNAGVMAPVEIALPRCLLNPPMHQDPARCAAVAGGNVETSQRVVDVVFGALGVAAASQGTMNNLLFGDERFGYYETICGGAGAGPGFDGADAVHTHMTNTRATDPEVLERRYPVRLRCFAIRKGSGGAGRFRGGDGVVRQIEFVAPLEVSLVTQRRRYAPYGLNGGQPGDRGRNLLLRSGSDLPEVLDPCTQFQARPGDRLIIETPGGGGCGDPVG